MHVNENAIKKYTKVNLTYLHKHKQAKLSTNKYCKSMRWLRLLLFD